MLKLIRKICSQTGRRVLLMSLAVAAILTTLAVGGIYAKYVHNGNRFGLVGTPSFYFQSDLLMASGARYTLNSGTKSVTFTLTNSADDLRFSDEDISYTVTSDGGSLSVTEGSLTKAKKSEVTVTLSGLEDGKTYTVTAVGVAGFEETLTATFTVESDAHAVYMHTDTSNPAFVVLTVWTKDLAGTVTVTIPEGLIPDNTDPSMRDFTTETRTLSFELIAYSSVSYRFFVGTWDKTTQFGVMLNGEPAKVETQLK